MNNSLIQFWNGNKSTTRQNFELLLVKQILALTEASNNTTRLEQDLTDYPDPRDEGQIFHHGIDLCVTVAGNPKFNDGDYIPVYEPLLNGLLGHRLLIIRQADARQFAQIKQSQQLQAKTIGIPATWADANLFRDNGYNVSEKGSLDNIFVRLARGENDYVALGVNEIHDIFELFAQPLQTLMIEPTLRLYYPFALVFYVSPHKPELATRIKQGIRGLKAQGIYQNLFNDTYGEIIRHMQLPYRNEIQLTNHALPEILESSMQLVRSQLF